MYNSDFGTNNSDFNTYSSSFDIYSTGFGIYSSRTKRTQVCSPTARVRFCKVTGFRTNNTIFIHNFHTGKQFSNLPTKSAALQENAPNAPQRSPIECTKN